MATAQTTAEFLPPSGYTLQTLAGSVTADAQFPVQPAVGHQVLVPTGLTVDAQLNFDGEPDTYTVYHITSDGMAYAVAYEIAAEEEPPAEPTGTSAITTATFVPPSGYTLQTLAGSVTADAQFPVQPAVGHQILVPTGLEVDAQLNFTGEPDTYTIYHITSDGTAYAVAYEIAGEEEPPIEPTGTSATTSAFFVPPPGKSFVSLVDPSDNISHSSSDPLDHWDFYPATGDQVVWPTDRGFFTADFLWVGNDDQPVEFTFIRASTGVAYTRTLTQDGLAEVPGEAPAGAVSIGTVTKSHNSYSIPFTYPLEDATSFQAQTNGGEWVTVTSPVTNSAATAETSYTVAVRPVNATGEGEATTVTFTTDVAPEVPIDPPAGIITFDEPGVSWNSASLPYSYSAADQTGFQYRVNVSEWISAPNPIQLSSLSPETIYNADVRAVNSGGAGTIYSTTFTTLSMPDGGTVTLGSSQRPRRVGNRKGVRPAANKAVYSPIYRG